MSAGVVDGTYADVIGRAAAGTTLRWSAGLSCRRVPAHPAAAGTRADQVKVTTLTGDLASLAVGGLAAALADVFLAAFAGPPWNETPARARQLPARMLAEVRQPGFVLALALTRCGGLAGFGYGLPRGPAPDSSAYPLPSAGPEPFQLCELAVRPSARGTGAGQALHDGILAVSGPRPRWLVTHLAAGPAVRLYQSRGWQVGRVLPGDAGGSSRLLMTRRY